MSGNTKGLRSLIREKFAAAGFRLHETQLDLLALLLHELKRWNSKINLTGLKTDEAMVVVLLMGSAAFLSAHSFGNGERVMDLGSGAGFPGVPLKILAPEIDLTLVEARRKKTIFLKHLIRLLRLADTRCLSLRAEELARETETQSYFHTITARAAGRLEKVLPLATPLLDEGGLFITMKGAGYIEEVENCSEIMERCNLELLRVVCPRWTEASSRAHVLVFKKVRTKL